MVAHRKRTGAGNGSVLDCKLTHSIPRLRVELSYFLPSASINLSKALQESVMRTSQHSIIFLGGETFALACKTLPIIDRRARPPQKNRPVRLKREGRGWFR
ncbi:hypothetical protein MTP99_000309 [Tenebrio molitor]|jgi:hypothetical protein|nr:hypothetical protein MTP99_000309 [Tenebrio molitor]